MAKLKTSDLRPGDIIQKDGMMYNVEHVFPEKVVAKHVLDIMDLEGWEKVDLYGKLRKD